MPQLSLYIDKETLHKVEMAAKIENLSISKYVVQKLNDTLNKSWPENFDKLFGSIADDTFNEPQKMSFDMDIDREKL
jgi:DNA polymerase sigma